MTGYGVVASGTGPCWSSFFCRRILLSLPFAFCTHSRQTIRRNRMAGCLMTVMPHPAHTNAIVSGIFQLRLVHLIACLTSRGVRSSAAGQFQFSLGAPRKEQVCSCAVSGRQEIHRRNNRVCFLASCPVRSQIATNVSGSVNHQLYLRIFTSHRHAPVVVEPAALVFVISGRKEGCVPCLS